MYVGHKIIMHTKFVDALVADVDSGCIVNDDMTWSIEVPTTLWGRFWAWVC